VKRRRRSVRRKSVPRRTAWRKRPRTRRRRSGLLRSRRSDWKRLDERRLRARSAKRLSRRRFSLLSKLSVNAPRWRRRLRTKQLRTRPPPNVSRLLPDLLNPFPSDPARPQPRRGTAPLSLRRTSPLRPVRAPLCPVLPVLRSDLSRRRPNPFSSNRSLPRATERLFRHNSTLPASDRVSLVHHPQLSRLLPRPASTDRRPCPPTRRLEVMRRSRLRLSSSEHGPRPSVLASRKPRRAASPAPTKRSPLPPRRSAHSRPGMPRATLATPLRMHRGLLRSLHPARSVAHPRSSMLRPARQLWGALCRRLSLSRSSDRQRWEATTRLFSLLAVPSLTGGTSPLPRLPVLADGRPHRLARSGALPVRPTRPGRHRRLGSPRSVASAPDSVPVRLDKPSALVPALSAAYSARRAWARRCRASNHCNRLSPHSTVWATGCIPSRPIISNTIRRGTTAARLRAVVLADQEKPRRSIRLAAARLWIMAGQSGRRRGGSGCPECCQRLA